MPVAPEQIIERIKQLDSSDLQFDRADDIIKLILQSSRKLSPDELSLFKWPNDHQSQPQKNTPAATDKIHLIFGSGLAQSRGELADQGFSDLFILEPDPGLLCLFLAAVDPRKIFPDTRLHCYCNLDNCLRQLREEQNFWRSIKMLQLPFCVARNPEIAERLQQEVKVSNAIAAEESKTIEKHYFTWAAHEYRNLIQLAARPHASSLAQRYREIPAILIGAGPSLPAALPVIGKIKDRCLVVAASTALRALEKAGIVPDLTIIIEGKKQSHFDSLAEEYREKLNLLAALKTHPSHLHYDFQGIYWFHNQTSPLVELLAACLPGAEPLVASGNVINEGLQFVLAAGCNPIILSGCDLAFARGCKYAGGLEKPGAENEDRDKLFFPVSGYNNEELTAPPEFLAYARNLEKIIRAQRADKPELEIINISSGGRRLAGCRPMSPAAGGKYVLEKKFREKPDLPAAGEVGGETKIRRDYLAKHYRRMEQLEKLIALIVNKNGAGCLQVDFMPARYLLAELPEFSSGIALQIIPWLRRLHNHEISLEDLRSLHTACRQLLAATESQNH